MLNKKPRIGIYMPGDGTGGPWRYVHSLLKGIDLDEFEVSLFSDIEGGYKSRTGIRTVLRVCPTRGQRLGSASRPGTACHQSIAKRTWKVAVPRDARMVVGFAREIKALSTVFRKSPVDLLHTNNTGCEESAIAARGSGIRRVLGTFHVDSTYDLHRARSGAAYRFLEHLSNHALTAGIGVSHATSTDWQRRTHLSLSKIVTIHNGIDASQFHRREDQRVARAALGLPMDDYVIVGAVGRLEEAKGFAHLIDAFAAVRARCEKVRLVFAGQGPLKSLLQQRASDAGVSDRVTFLGFCNDVQRVYDAVDILALSSLCEALPYVLLEAMASRLPIIGTRVGGVPEVIADGESGFLVPPRDKGAMTSALRALIVSADLRNRMGIAGRGRVEKHFTEREMVSKTIALYRRLSKGNASRSAL